MSIKTKEVQGAVTEHWMDKRLRQNKPIDDPSNVPRISADTLVKMLDLRNSLLGSKYTMQEWMEQLRTHTADYREHKKFFKKRMKKVVRG